MRISIYRPAVTRLLVCSIVIGLSAIFPVRAVDTSPPTSPVVTDDGDYTSCTNDLHVVWAASQDSESGITRYEYAIGSTPGGTNIVGWTPVGMATEATAAGLSLSPGTAYYLSVKAVNGVGLSSIGTANGISVDTTNRRIVFQSDNASSYPTGFVPRYEKYEASFLVNGLGQEMVTYSPYKPIVNPLGSEYYNSLHGIAVDAILTAPSGRKITWPCFWYEAADGWKGWKLRFAPTEVGTWKYRLRAATQYGTLVCCQNTFQCTGAAGHGFVRIDSADRRFFEFTDGTPVYLLGSNLSGCSIGGGVEGAAAVAFPELARNGANFSRVFYTSINIEPYNTTTDKCQVKSLNIYSQQRCRSIDAILGLAHQHGIYLEWVIDDWTYIKDSSSQYIRPGDCSREAPAVNTDEFFGQSMAGFSKEIYKRKLRYWIARWGYSTNLLALDLINEVDNSGAPEVSWHNEMCDYIHSFSEQPHLASSSNGSGWMSTEHGIDWGSASIDYANFHDYAKYSNQWPYLHSPYDLEKLGIDSVWPDPPQRGTCDDNGYPWVDTAVWVDRIARLYHKRCQWNKPLLWSEFGLIYRDCASSGFPDWDAAYIADPTAEHVRSAIWASVFSGCTVSHWKLDYMLGTSPYTAGGNKMWIFAPLSRFLAGENLRNMTQETAYPTADPLDPNPQLKCLAIGSSSPEPRVMAMAWHNSTTAFVYVKNLTNVWSRSVDPSIAPFPSPQSAAIKILGMAPGRYVVEKWSTTDANAATQKISSNSINVGSDGIATIEVFALALDLACKLKPEDIMQPGLKGQADGSSVQVSGAVVTISWYQILYMEPDDRSWGIRVEMPDMYFDIGTRVDVEGAVRTKPSGERYIEATSVSQSPAPLDQGWIEPLCLNCRALGGGDWHYLPSTGAGQRGVDGGSGLNNIGMLVRICGYVTGVNIYDGYYYIDDGSGIKDGTTTPRYPYASIENVGVRIEDWTRRFVPGQRVIVPGISSCFKVGECLKRFVLPRFGEEIAF